jgi:predicted DNA binding CopG/RHH family protein
MSPRKGQRMIPDADRKKHQIGIRLMESELNALEKISGKEGLPVSYFAREGIKMVIKKYSK